MSETRKITIKPPPINVEPINSAFAEMGRALAQMALGLRQRSAFAFTLQGNHDKTREILASLSAEQRAKVATVARELAAMAEMNACEHPEAIEITAFTDKAERFHCPACSHEWNGDPRV